MNFDLFWKRLSNGGQTRQGDQYTITQDSRLHIISPGNNNQFFYISKKTVKRYFTEDIPNMGEVEFRKSRSSYFYNVYSDLMR
jgi:hypothetical protein